MLDKIRSSGLAVVAAVCVVVPLRMYAMTCRGVIVDGETGEPVDLATVTLYDEVDKWLAGCMTDSAGVFVVSADRPAWRLVVSRIGYEVIDATAGGELPGDVGTIAMRRDSSLDEVVVRGSNEFNALDKRVIVITDALRENIANGAQLLDRLDGFSIDPISEMLRVGTEADVTILVNGAAKSLSYIMGLNPRRIKSVTVLQNPQGRYVGQQYVVDIQLFADYYGLDVNVGLEASKSLLYYKDIETPAVSLNYAHGNVSLLGDLSYRRFYSEIPVMYSRTSYFSGLYDMTVSSDGSCERYDNNRFRMTVGAEWLISGRHSLIAQVGYAPEVNDYYRSTSVLFTEDCGVMEAGCPGAYDERADSRLTPHDLVASLYYRGRFSDRFKIENELDYNYYTARQCGGYDTEWYGELAYGYSRRKDDIINNLWGTYDFAGGYQMLFLYELRYRRYRNSLCGEPSPFFSSSMLSNTVTFVVSGQPCRQFAFNIGATFSPYTEKNGAVSRSATPLSPHGFVTWIPDARWRVVATYSFNTAYPNLEALSDATVPVNPFMVSRGNPSLRVSGNHRLLASVSYSNRIYLTYSYRRDDEAFDNKLVRRDGDAMRYVTANVNTDNREHQAMLSFTVSPVANLDVSGNGSYSYRTVRYAGCGYGVSGWMGWLSLRYNIVRVNMYAGLSFYCDNGSKPWIQGEHRMYTDYLSVTLGGSMARGRLSYALRLNVSPSATPRYARTVTEDDGYACTAYSDTHQFNHNVELRLRWTIGNGRVKARLRDTGAQRE